MSVTPIRLFDVECECGGEFRVSFGASTAGPRPETGFLAPPSGQCPHCGLRLEQVEPPGSALRPPEGRSRA